MKVIEVKTNICFTVKISPSEYKNAPINNQETE
jgi:hypothetical protein